MGDSGSDCWKVAWRLARLPIFGSRGRCASIVTANLRRGLQGLELSPALAADASIRKLGCEILITAAATVVCRVQAQIGTVLAIIKRYGTQRGQQAIKKTTSPVCGGGRLSVVDGAEHFRVL